MGHSFIRSLVRSHRSLVRFLRTARFAALVRSLAHSLLSSWDSRIFLSNIQDVLNHCKVLPMQGVIPITLVKYFLVLLIDEIERKCDGKNCIVLFLFISQQLCRCDWTKKCFIGHRSLLAQRRKDWTSSEESKNEKAGLLIIALIPLHWLML